MRPIRAVHPKAEEFLGVDVGSVKIGIARGSSVARLAAPLKTVAAASAFDELIQLSAQNQVSAIVVGLPRNLNGAETTQTVFVRDWAKQAKDQIKLPFFWQDEALTSQKAESLKPKTSQFDDHALAAAIILQDFLDTPESDRLSV